MQGQTARQGPPDSTEPRIYVACLSAYNNGHLHGRWIRAAQDPELIYDEIYQMLATSPSPQAEEWAIHDYEGFTPHDICETEDIPTIARIAMEIIQHRLVPDTLLGKDRKLCSPQHLSKNPRSHADPPPRASQRSTLKYGQLVPNRKSVTLLASNSRDRGASASS